MELGLRGQVAVVVGAASGIGRGIAAAFAAEGVRVVLTGPTMRPCKARR
jgi:NAD(P)-dependent dehydrogenase (short-subunit alcohol dehydrogenase family)